MSKEPHETHASTACAGGDGFSTWESLDRAGIVRAPDGPAAVQIRVAEGLVDYPRGRSAMVFFFFAERSARRALLEKLDTNWGQDERGLGQLWYRCLQGPGAREELEGRWDAFYTRFGAPPCLHRDE